KPEERSQVDPRTWSGERFVAGTGLPLMREITLRRTLFAKLAGAQAFLFFVLGAVLLVAIDRGFDTRQLLELTVGLAIAAVLSSVLAAALIFHAWSRRLRALTEAVDRFREGGFAEPLRLTSFDANGDDVDQLAIAVQEMSERIARQLQLLAHTEVSRRELLANVSHDLRTPLASMQGYLETLLLKHGTIPSEEERGYLEVAAKHSERLGQLIRDLFQLTKLEAREVKPQCEEFSMSELIQDVVQKFTLTAQKRGVRLETQVSQQQVHVYADIGMIESVLENLMENAIRHTPAGGVIRLEVSPAPDRLTIRVADSGRGIPDDELKNIFDRYYHVDRGEMSDIGRTGLGLAITRHIVELHGGTINVASALGEGTTFSFDLPTC
ncbi:MAG TPA: ATP-binding protein, partial [Pyrinomonadaceae bacterium]